MKAMSIPALGRLLTTCWTSAEEVLRESLKEIADSDEEFITKFFHAKLRLEFEKVSASGAVARAFLSDLDRAFPKVAHTSLSKISSGLVATVILHDRPVEARTGGDLGLVVTRPDVREVVYRNSQLDVSNGYQRGLLCQAKIFRRTSKWGSLTPKQMQTLPNKLQYLALLLYRYTDQKGERRELAPFSWQVAGDATVRQISQWLISDRFPSLQNSQQVIGALLRDKIGTDDKKLIETDIAPPLRPSLVIKIRWKDDRPGGTVHVQKRVTNQIKRQVHLQQ